MVATASSEETPTEDPMGGEGYSVAFDPLDGSSIIDTNFAVGTIFGIWPGSRCVFHPISLVVFLSNISADILWLCCRLTGIKGKDLAAAGISVYGPRTTITLALKGVEGAHEFLLIDDFTARHGQWVKTNTFTAIGYVFL